MLLYASAQINETALRHVLRSFRTMSRGGEAEKQLARLLMLPFIDLNFTQVSKPDGSKRVSDEWQCLFFVCVR